MFFEKDSLRTRLTFQAGMASMGGNAHFVDQTQSRIDAREKLSDIAHNLERWMDGIVLRTFAQQTIEGMAEHASVPVVNALSDFHIRDIQMPATPFRIWQAIQGAKAEASPSGHPSTFPVGQ